MTGILVAHMNLVPNAQQVAAALHERGALAAYATTLGENPASRLQQHLCRLADVLGVDLRGQLARRRVLAFPVEKALFHPWREIIRMLQVRLIGNEILGDTVFHWARDGFDAWAAGLVASGRYSACYAFETGALQSLRAARAAGLPGFYEVLSTEHDYTETLIADEVARFPQLDSPYRRHVRALQDARTEFRRQEWEAASHVLAASNFSRDTWLARGWSPRPVSVIPYGAPPVQEDRLRPADGPFPVLVWAGTFSIRKGAHLLLDALRALEAAGMTGFEVHVYGAIDLPDAAMQPLPSSLRLKGSVAQPVLFEAMAGAAALLFPTLCDAFGMVVTEALALGLPVITTRRAGAADLLQHGVNGLIIEAGSAAAIADGIREMLARRASWPDMRAAAAEAARRWQWSDYRQALAAVLLPELLLPEAAR